MQLNIFILEQKGQKLNTLNLQVFFCRVIFVTAADLQQWSGLLLMKYQKLQYDHSGWQHTELKLQEPQIYFI